MYLCISFTCFFSVYFPYFCKFRDDVQQRAIVMSFLLLTCLFLNTAHLDHTFVRTPSTKLVSPTCPGEIWTGSVPTVGPS